MAITIQTPRGPVTAQEIVQGYEESVDLQYGPRSRKGYLVDWVDRFWVAIGFLGLSRTTSQANGLITLQTPLRHPELTTTYAHSVEIQGVGAPIQGSSQLAYNKCIVWVNYQALPWSFSPNNQINPNQPIIFAEQKIASSVDSMTLPGYGLFWKTGGIAAQMQSFQYRMAMIDIEISLKNFPYMPSPAALTQAGTINFQEYFGVNPGSLMFMGVTTNMGADASGNIIQATVDYKFVARSLVWNGYYNPATQGFDILSTANPYVSPTLQNIAPWGTGCTSVIPYSDFTQIFPTAYTSPSGWVQGQPYTP